MTTDEVGATPWAGPVTVQALPRDGWPRRAFRLSVPLTRAPWAVCSTAIHLSVSVRDPASGALVKRRVAPTGMRIANGVLTMTMPGPVSTGSRLVLAPGALREEGNYSAATSMTVDGPLAPWQATLWFKPYRPTDRKLLPSRYSERPPSSPRGYGASHPPAYRRFADDAALTAALERVYARFIDAGRLTPARAAHYLALVHDPAARAVFTGPGGRFHRTLMAAILANAGTVGEPAIAALIEGDNATGRPARVFFDVFVRGHLAQAGVENGRLVVRVNPHQALVEPFELLAPILGAHETFHQDNRIGRHEEVIASYAAYVAAARHYLVNPALARADTRLSRVLNVRILMMLNSGRGRFPCPGLLAATPTQGGGDVVPGTAAEPWPSLATFVRRLYADVADIDTSGNPYADRVLSALVGRSVSGIGFNAATVRRLDARTRALNAREQFELMRILRLAPARKRNTLPVRPLAGIVDKNWRRGYRPEYEHRAVCQLSSRAST